MQNKQKKGNTKYQNKKKKIRNRNTIKRGRKKNLHRKVNEGYKLLVNNTSVFK